MAAPRMAVPTAFMNSASLLGGGAKLRARASVAQQGAKLPGGLRARKPLQARQRVVRAMAVDKAKLMGELSDCLAEYKALPPSMKADGSLEASTKVLDVMNQLKEAGMVSKFGSVEPARRAVFPRELTTVGIQNQESIGVPSIRNDAAFLISVVGVTSFFAVIFQFLPGEWGFFMPYATAGISIVVLAIGSTAPGLLEVLINQFSKIFPDYRQRTLQHEAGHFLAAYLCGVPITGYSLDLGKEHTDLLESKLQRRILGAKNILDEKQVDLLAVVSMAGVAAEGMNFEEVVGQNSDLMLLQRVLNKSETKLPDNTQQSITRWAVWASCNLLNDNKAAYEALCEKMRSGASVAECIEAIEAN